MGICFVAIFLVFSFVARFGVLYKDDWDWVAPLLFDTPLGDYIRLVGNEHVIVLPRLLMWLDYRLNGHPGPIMWATGLSCYLLSTLALARHQWSRSGLSRSMARITIGVTLSLLFFTYQLQVFLSPAGITIPMVLLTAVAAMLATIRACNEVAPGPRRASWWWSIAAVSSLAGLLTSGQGLATPLAMMAITLVARPRNALSVATGIAVCAALVVPLYALATGAQPPTLNSAVLGQTMMFGLAFFAGPLAFLNVPLALSAGTAIVATGLLETRLVVRTKERASDCQQLCIGLIVFVLGTCILTTAARAKFGVAQASQSRYALFAMLFLSATFTLSAIRVSHSETRRRNALRAAFLALLVLSTIALPADLFIGAVWQAKAENARTAELALRAKVPDLEWIRTLHPDAQRIYAWSHTVYALQRDPLPAVPSTNTCDGSLQLRTVDGGGGRFFRMTGRVAASPTATIVLHDAGGVTRGLANVAPMVDVPDPTYQQVISAVARALFRDQPEPRWFGFAAGAADLRDHALVVDGDRAICIVPVHRQ